MTDSQKYALEFIALAGLIGLGQAIMLSLSIIGIFGATPGQRMKMGLLWFNFITVVVFVAALAALATVWHD